VERLEALIAAMEQSARSAEPGPQTEQDLEFHRVVLAAGGRPVLLAAMEATSGKAGLLISFTRRHAPLDVVPGIHRPILETLRSGDPARAASSARAHVEYGRQVLLQHFANESGESGESGGQRNGLNAPADGGAEPGGGPFP
jgi:DNA-binding GntR family transcriptional regulator